MKKRFLKMFSAGVVALALILSQGKPAAAGVLDNVGTWSKIGTRGFEKASEDGFGSRHNSYAWSMAWFKGKLYVGTNRDMLCYLSMVFGSAYPPDLPDVECENNPDFRGEIWAYDPEKASDPASAWELVYKAPEISVGSGVSVTRDQGYRGMFVAIEPGETGETEALYIGGYLSKELMTNLPARLLRTTDGKNFKEVRSTDGAVMGNIDAFGLRSFAQYNGKLYMTANMNPPDKPKLMELDLSTVKSEGNLIKMDIRQVNPPDVQAFEVAVFNNYLYTGTMDPKQGFSVLKTEAKGDPPYEFTPVVINGAWRLDRSGDSAYNLNEYAVSMCVFNNRLYIGTGCGLGGYDFVAKIGPAAAEMIRIDADDSWQLICGSKRNTPQGYKVPISHLPVGMGNPFSGYFWRMAVHRDWLYVATMDSSIALRNPDMLGKVIPEEYQKLVDRFGERITNLFGGFDLWKTRNGVQWYPVTTTGFGDKFNIGVRTMVSTPLGLFVGTANPYYGAQVWLGDDHFPFAKNLQAEPDGGAVNLRWTAPAGNTVSHIYRKQIPLGDGLGLLEEDRVGLLGLNEIAVTTNQYFVDNDVEQRRAYLYQVRSETEEGKLSDRSNLAICRTMGDQIFVQEPRQGRRFGQWWSQVVTVVNKTDEPLSSFLNLILEGLPEGVSLRNRSGIAENGSPFLSIPLNGEGLLPREKIRLQLLFSDPNRSRIWYRPFVTSDPVTP